MADQDHSFVSKRHDVTADDVIVGVPLYRPDGKKLGVIKRVAVDSRAGNVIHVVVEVGGLLGLGEATYVLPRSQLHYDATAKRCEADISEDELYDASAADGLDWQRKIAIHYAEAFAWR